MTDPNDKYRPPARPPTVAVDFDGTLCEWAFPECGAPRTEVIEALRILREKGWQIIIHTCRVNSHWEEPERTEKVQDMLEWLTENEVPFDAVWGLAVERPARKAINDYAPRDWGIPGRGWIVFGEPNGFLAWRYSTETGKPLADVYLDDRGIGFCECQYGDPTIAFAEVLESFCEPEA